MTIQSYHGDVMMLVSGQERVTGQLAAPHRVAMLRAAVTVGGLGEPHPPPHPLPGYTGCLAQLSLDSNHVNLMQTSKGIIVLHNVHHILWFSLFYFTIPLVHTLHIALQDIDSSPLLQATLMLGCWWRALAWWSATWSPPT